MRLQNSFSPLKLDDDVSEPKNTRKRDSKQCVPQTQPAGLAVSANASISLVNSSSADLPSLQSYWDSQLADAVDNDSHFENSSRVRVHNTLFRVPCHLERLVWVGVLSCLDSIMTLATVVPLRVIANSTKTLSPNLLYDAISSVVLITGVYVHLSFIEPGMLYFGMKDVTAEFLKITLVYVALDVADKILNNIGVDVSEMLRESCIQYCNKQISFLSFVGDSLVFLIVNFIHSLVVMSIAMVWYMSMESETTVLAFMIISNFGEIKTTVFKRFDSSKLFALCRMDVVERIDLLIAALFIVVEDLGQQGQWTLNRDLLAICFLMLVLESTVDIIKHSVVVNFNDIRPGIYRDFLRDVVQNLKQTKGKGTAKKMVLEPVGPTMILLRVIFSAAAVGNPSQSFKLVFVLGAFSVLFLMKFSIGWGLQLSAWWYLHYYQKYYGHVKPN